MDHIIIRNLKESYDIDTEQEISFVIALQEHTSPVNITLRELGADAPFMVQSLVSSSTAGGAADQAIVHPDKENRYRVTIRLPKPNGYRLEVTTTDSANNSVVLAGQNFLVFSGIAPKDVAATIATHEGVPNTLVRGAAPRVTDDEWIWVRVLAASEAFSYKEYRDFVAQHFREGPRDGAGSRRSLGSPSSNVRSYTRLKEVTEQFMRDRCEDSGLYYYLDTYALDEAQKRLARRTPDKPISIENLVVVSERLPIPTAQYRLECLEPRGRFHGLCAVELIWNYWLEEAMLVQTMKAISRRFQNRRSPHGIDPLANFETDPLRPLNNFLWGYVEDEQHRLSVVRRAHEYEHHYGLPMKGLAVSDVRPADRRSKFIESFHNLLYRCVHFYRQLDDLTVRPDGFPVLNAVKETHYLIAQGAHNQFGDLPEVARREMLMEQWLLGRTETRDFLRARDMVPYPEDWMDRVDAMKNIQGWIDTSVVHFNDLAKFGEKILLSIRYGSWASQNNPDAATSWARFFRQEIQGYIHGYRAVTGVDLASEVSHPRQTLERYSPPSEHLQRRLAAQSAGAR